MAVVEHRVEVEVDVRLLLEQCTQRRAAVPRLLREALDSVLTSDLDAWMRVAREERAKWKRDSVPMEERRPLLLEALNRIYERRRADEAARERTTV